MPRMHEGKHVTQAAKVFQQADDYWHNNEFKLARDHYLKAAELYGKNDDKEGEAFALSRLGELDLSLDHYDNARASLSMAANIVEDFEDGQNTYGEVLIKLSKLESAIGEYEKSLELIEKAERILDNIVNNNLLGEALDHKAYVYLEIGEEDLALNTFMRAAKLYNKEGITLKEAAAIRAASRIEMKRRKYDKAHDLLERCRAIYKENGDLLGEASSLSAIGCIRFAIKDIDKARKALMKSVYLYSKATHYFAEAEALLYLARVESYDNESGDFDRAKTHYKKSIELFEYSANETMKKAVIEEYYNFLNRIGQ
jgi:tetratricopeptide (TPR) repeat protein